MVTLRFDFNSKVRFSGVLVAMRLLMKHILDSGIIGSEVQALGFEGGLQGIDK